MVSVWENCWQTVTRGFVFITFSLKKSSTPRKKYGLLTNYDDTVEMTQLESDEDDNTVYEAKSLRRCVCVCARALYG